MKKILALVLSLAMMLGLASCAKKVEVLRTSLMMRRMQSGF